MPLAQTTSSSNSSVSITNLPDLVSVPVIQNIDLGTAGTENTISIPDGSRVVKLYARNCAKLQLSYTATESGTKYLTIEPGERFSLPDRDATAGFKLYIQADVNNAILEVESWS